MKRSLKNLAAVVSASALTIVAAPAAQAQGLEPCTVQYVRDVSQTSSPQLVVYTPPATVTVNGNAVVGMADYVVDVTGDYVRCLVSEGGA